MTLAMTDKLSALKGQSGRGVSEYSFMENEEDDKDVDKVLLTAGELTKVISKMRKVIQRIKENNNAMLTSVNNQAAKDKNESLNEEVKSLSRQVHAQFKRMKAEVESEERGPQRNSADLRIKKAQFNTLSRLFKEAMDDYNTEQESYREKSKERIHKQLQYAGRSITEDQLEKMLESEDTHIFTQDLMLVTAQKRAALGECEARHKELLDLEGNIRELHDMFYDIAILVDEQGELIDRIECNVENASVYVYHGRGHMKKAVEVNRSARRTKWLIFFLLCCCCLCFLVAGAIVAVVVIYMQVNKK